MKLKEAFGYVITMLILMFVFTNIYNQLRKEIPELNREHKRMWSFIIIGSLFWAIIFTWVYVGG